MKQFFTKTYTREDMPNHQKKSRIVEPRRGIKRGGYAWLACALLVMGCGSDDKKFRLIAPGRSGITFRNTLHESVDFNIFNYMYFYNGGGVAIGDVSGDGLPDVFLTSNQDADKLYLNLGNFKFRDISEEAGVEGFKGWTTGVTMADVNSDGKLDIYVSHLGDYLIYKGKNQLFINEGNDEQGIPRFTDRAMELGLDLVGFSTQAVFFDYDRDADLDMFMLNHSLHQNGTFGKSTLRDNTHPLAGDKLMRNDNGRFVDVTLGSGIYSSVIGYGLGVAVSDVNLDGWPDIYVGNDFHENDYLYINQGNGTFKEELDQQMNHTSRYTMGVDFADINNDAFPDGIAMDMLPEDPVILKASAAEDPYDVYTFKLDYGFNHQFARNTLQLNNRNGTFSEIGLQAGVAATDWSWSALFADFDLDGFKDLLVTNGILRRSNDLDYINFVSVDSVQMKMEHDMGETELSHTEKMPKIKLPNYLFSNNGDSTFTNRAPEWGLGQPSYSNGAAYGDLDDDGDLDLVINNVEDEAFLYENRTIVKGKQDTTRHHYVKVRLKGTPGNLFGIGAKVFLYDNGKVQMQECLPTRGYQSAVDPNLVFGTCTEKEIDSLIVVWNDGRFERMNSLRTDQTIVLDQQKATGTFHYGRFHTRDPLFVRASENLALPYRHEENRFVEFNREALIPHMMSSEGPACAVADVNNDGREDLYAGGAKRIAGQLFVQTADGKFKALAQPVFKADSTYEDVDAVFFDADGDKDNDLFVVSGGNEFSGRSKYRLPRLYLNNGAGAFTRSNGIPDLFLTGSCVSINDIDGDGDTDLFLGARAIPWRYGIKPDSYILLNNGKGMFTDATAAVAPSLLKFGFAKDATWADMDGDRVKDLVVAAEWSPVTILRNTNGKLIPMPLDSSGLEMTHGWWNVVEPLDADNDGDMDLIAGNLGMNTKLHTSVNEPVRLFVSDFDKNDSTDQVLSHYNRGNEYPFYTRDEMTKQMPFLKKRFLSYRKYAEAKLQDIFSDDILDKAERYTAYTFETALIENLGNGKFSVKALPRIAQFSTVNAVLAGDFNGDKKTDVLLAGNFYPSNIQMGRYDASYGVLLLGDGRGGFKAVPPSESGFSVKGQVRCLRKLRVGGKEYYLAVRNNDTMEVFAEVIPQRDTEKAQRNTE